MIRLLVARLGTGLAAVSVALHIAGLGGMAPPWAIVMLALALVCAGCAIHLWHGGTARAWTLMATCSGAMLGIHALMMSTPSGDHGSADMPRDSMGTSTGHTSMGEHATAHLHGQGWDLMHYASAVAVAELLLAVAVLGIGLASRQSQATGQEVPASSPG
ncbi:hypothetical protein [Nocardia sp. NPDC004860]|uniref:hypothetical protein n=1 Tax=Nocardia sp. NPDC004860 TaxID=3154557 RepID=UPI0033AE20E5